MSVYHRVSRMVSAEQAPAEYMGGGLTHLTDFDPESGEYGAGRYERRRGEGPPQEAVDSWVAMFNMGAQVLEIAQKSGYPYLTVQNEIAKHPGKSRGRESTVPMSVHLTDDLAERVEKARDDEPRSKFVLQLLETAISGPAHAKAAAKAPTDAEVDRWLRMHGRGMSFSQIAEAVGRYPRDVSGALRARLGLEPRKKRRKGTPRKTVSVRMPLWLKNLLDAAAEAAGTTRAKLMQALVGRELDRAGA